MSESTIGDIIRKAERDYTTGETTLGKYVTFSQYENIEKIDAYLNSKHITGDTDSMGREKPFFNIVTGAVNIWFRATDIDRKDVRIKATKSEDSTAAFLATVHLQEWMRRENFGQVLNDWGRALARYGSAVLKFVEKKDKLHVEVVPWNRLISDTVDFDNNPKIEKLYLTPAQLRKNKAYDQDQVTELLSKLEARKTQDKTKKDNKIDYIEVFELHGELSLEHLTGDEKDRDQYQQQIQVVSFVKCDDSKDGDDYDDFTLLKGKEKKDPYMITHLIKEDGRSQSIGAVEHLFESQWMSNHSVKSIKDQLDLASKLIFQTSDGNFVGKNVLSAIETGDILIHAENQPLTNVANSSHDIASLQSFGNQWQALAKEITSTPDSMSGGTMPSGTAYRTVAILNQESHSLFEIMTENKGLAIEEMLRLHVIPFLKKKMDTADEIGVTLESYHLDKVDKMYVPYEATKRLAKKVIGSILQDGTFPEVTDEIKQRHEQAIKGELDQQGNQRFFKPDELPDVTWKQMFEDLEWEVEVEVTNEQSDKETVMTTLTTLLQSIGGNPNILQDPNMRLLFNKILETTGAISPIELTSVAKQSSESAAKAPANKVSQSINFKDLPPEAQAQMAAEVGIKIDPASVGGGALPVKK